jgi:DNA (cytosine-5)-methyltransferase 1
MQGGGREPKILQSDDYKIRKLTPLECWRLMGFSDADFYAAKSIVTSNAQLYKQAGNSIVVTVLEAIFRQLFLKKHNKKQGIIAEQISLFQGVS